MSGRNNRGSKRSVSSGFLMTVVCAIAVIMVTVYFVGAHFRSDADGDAYTGDDPDAGRQTDAALSDAANGGGDRAETEGGPFNIVINTNPTPPGGSEAPPQGADGDAAEPLAAVTPIKLTAEHEHKWVAATCTQPAVCRVCGCVGAPANGHSWSGSTCTEASVCDVCGYRGEGAQGHRWTEATCEHPRKCTVCGLEDGEPAEHKWASATCTKPKTCTVCGKTSGEAQGHKWKSATCTTPEICTVCGKTQGSAKGHTWVEATASSPKKCSVCGKTEGDKLANGVKVSAMKYTEADLKMLASLIYLEAGGGSNDGMWAVGTVVINRVRSSEFPNTLEGVIYAKGQFSVASRVASTTPSQAAIDAAKKVLSGDLYDKDILYFKSASSSKSWGIRKFCFRVGNNYFYT